MTSLSATATPARAGNDDIAKVLFGALALGIIAKGISDARAEEPQQRHVVQAPVRHAPVIANRPNRPNRHQAQRIPANCAMEARIGNHGRAATVYRERCLRRSGIETARADNCQRSGVINGRNISYYTQACLRRAGFRF